MKPDPTIPQPFERPGRDPDDPPCCMGTANGGNCTCWSPVFDEQAPIQADAPDRVAEAEEWTNERAEAKAAADAERERKRIEERAAMDAEIAELEQMRARSQADDAGVVMTFDEVTEGLAAAMQRSSAGEPMYFDPTDINPVVWADGPTGDATSEFTTDNPNGPAE